MNCPGHCQLFELRKRSYRELPLRLAEFSRLHRNERSGTLTGLSRVRSMAQDDAHIFCEPEQVEAEIDRFFEMTREVYRALGLAGVRGRRLDAARAVPRRARGLGRGRADAGRRRSSARASTAASSRGEGAFYGPKIECRLRRRARPRLDARDDPDRRGDARRASGSRYVGRDGEEHQPAMLHRAVLGSLERFIALYVEHTGGDFPLWLAPVQVRGAADHRAPRATTPRGARRARRAPACAPSSTTATRSSASRSARPSSQKMPVIARGRRPGSAGRDRHAAPAPRHERGAEPRGAGRLRGRAAARRSRHGAPDGQPRRERSPDDDLIRRSREKDTPRINERIRAREIRVIGADGEQLGVMTPEAAHGAGGGGGPRPGRGGARPRTRPSAASWTTGKYKYEQKKKKAAGKTQGARADAEGSEAAAAHRRARPRLQAEAARGAS